MFGKNLLKKSSALSLDTLSYMPIIAKTIAIIATKINCDYL
jgi:hypothetical protein